MITSNRVVVCDEDIQRDIMYRHSKPMALCGCVVFRKVAVV